LVVALAGVMLAIGLWLSVVCGSRMRALGAARAVWLALPAAGAAWVFRRQDI
jgi:hypothetical protein